MCRLMVGRGVSIAAATDKVQVQSVQCIVPFFIGYDSRLDIIFRTLSVLQGPDIFAQIEKDLEILLSV